MARKARHKTTEAILQQIHKDFKNGPHQKKKKKAAWSSKEQVFLLVICFSPQSVCLSVCLSVLHCFYRATKCSLSARLSFPRSLSLSSVPVSSSPTWLVPSLLWPPPWLSLPNCLLPQRMSLERGEESLGKRSVDQEGTHTEDMYFYWGRWEDLFFFFFCTSLFTSSKEGCLGW